MTPTEIDSRANGVISGSGLEGIAPAMMTAASWLIWQAALSPIIDLRDSEAVKAAAVAIAAANTGRASGVQISNGVAIIRIEGVLSKRLGIEAMLFGGTSYLALASQLKALANDNAIDTIVAVIDSPGGQVNGVLEAVEAMKYAASQKPVIAQVDGLAASAAYWIASQASTIYANPTDIIGSVGVRMMLLDTSKLFADAGVEAIPIVTGERKAAGAMGLPVTDADKAMLQALVDRVGELFVGDVSRGRDLTDEAVQATATAAVFNAQAALELGLIDGEQSFTQTMQMVRAEQTARSRRRDAAAELQGALSKIRAG